VIYLGLGGNVGDDAAILARFTAVVTAFRSWGVVRASSVYRTAPIGPHQAAFLNAALEVQLALELTPAQWLQAIHHLERAQGRDRTNEAHWGPRPLDIDVLLWDGPDGRWPVGADWLCVPHPRLAQRRFALEPLLELVGPSRLLAGAPLSAWRDALLEQDVTPTPLTIS